MELFAVAREKCKRDKVCVMEKRMTLKPNWYLAAGAAVMSLYWACSPGPADSADAADKLGDGEKRRRIESMYAGYKEEFPEVSDIEPAQAMTLAAAGKVVFIDVREKAEQEVSMLPKAVTAEAFLKDPSAYDDYIKIGYCTISYRSGKFAQKLREQGIPVYNLRGGLLAWVHDGGSVFHGSQPTKRIHVYGRKWDLAPAAYETVW